MISTRQTRECSTVCVILRQDYVAWVQYEIKSLGQTILAASGDHDTTILSLMLLRLTEASKEILTVAESTLTGLGSHN